MEILIGLANLIIISIIVGSLYLLFGKTIINSIRGNMISKVLFIIAILAAGWVLWLMIAFFTSDSNWF